MQRCPVCRGARQLVRGGDRPVFSVFSPGGLALMNARRCDACDGMGVIGGSGNRLEPCSRDDAAGHGGLGGAPREPSRRV